MKTPLLFATALLVYTSGFSQNVGIGTTTPLQKLHVEGTTFLNGNVGIGNNSPTAPLSFNAFGVKIISLLHGAFGDAGFGVFGNELRIHSDYVGADITFGYDDYNLGFTEIMRIRGNGALLFDSNAGTTGQVLLSNGPAASPAWGYANSHYIGESYGGGVVFYVYDNGQHGLIASTANQGGEIRWYGGSYTNTRARADGVGAGLKNTAIIIANQGPVDGAAFAATVCNEYSVTVGGVTYGDWYLPSKYELNLLYLQKTVVGGFTPNFYWSSTEYNSNYAWFQYFFNGAQNTDLKTNINYVRAVRAF